MNDATDATDVAASTGGDTAAAAAGREQARPGHRDRVKIMVNKQAVRLDDDDVTGLMIKQAAIEQGVAIQLDFVLSLHLRDGGTRIIGDADRIEVDERSRFTAVAGDDNS